MQYTKKEKASICKEILQKIEEGESLREAIRQLGKPNRSTFNDWLNNDEVLASQYARACEMREEKIFDEILTIADDSTGDTVYTKKGVAICDNEFVQRSKLRIDARKWVLMRMNPRKFGDKTDITTGGQQLSGGVSEIIVNIIDPLDDDDFE